MYSKDFVLDEDTYSWYIEEIIDIQRSKAFGIFQDGLDRRIDFLKEVYFSNYAMIVNYLIDYYSSGLCLDMDEDDFKDRLRSDDFLYSYISNRHNFQLVVDFFAYVIAKREDVEEYDSYHGTLIVNSSKEYPILYNLFEIIYKKDEMIYMNKCYMVKINNFVKVNDVFSVFQDMNPYSYWWLNEITDEECWLPHREYILALYYEDEMSTESQVLFNHHMEECNVCSQEICELIYGETDV